MDIHPRAAAAAADAAARATSSIEAGDRTPAPWDYITATDRGCYIAMKRVVVNIRAR